MRCSTGMCARRQWRWLREWWVERTRSMPKRSRTPAPTGIRNIDRGCERKGVDGIRQAPPLIGTPEELQYKAALQYKATLDDAHVGSRT